MRRIREHTSAFTLIELLVVMTLIAILLGIGYPAFTSVMESARKTQAKNEEQQIVAAVNAYYTDYGKYAVNAANNTTNAYFGPGPVPAGSTSYGSNGVLVDVLRNNSNPSGPNYATVTLLNPRAIVFIQPPVSKDQTTPRSGIQTSTGNWYDPWGSQYNVMINWKYDNQITNPYTDAPGGATLNLGVMAWSFGKNGALGGGPAATLPPPSPAFTAEGGSNGNFSGSGDVISWQ